MSDAITEKTRLSSVIRQSTLRRLLDHTFKSRAYELVAKRAALALDLYNDTWSFTERQRMMELPEGWLKEENYVEVNLAGELHQLNFNGKVYLRGEASDHLRHLYVEAWRKQPVNAMRVPDEYQRRSFIASHDFATRNTQLQQVQERLGEDFHAAAKQGNTMLSGFATVGRLRDAWPEVAPFLPTIQQFTVVHQMPAIRVEELNSTFKLPAEELEPCT